MSGQSFDIIIAGAGPTGLAVANELYRHQETQQTAKFNVCLLEKGQAPGDSGPFESTPCIGVQFLSFNTSEHAVGSWLQRLSQYLTFCDDKLLSKSDERRQGWNRASGQWKQFRIKQQIGFQSHTPNFVERMFESRKTSATFKFNEAIDSISLNTSSTKWVVGTCSGCEYECGALIIALPASAVSSLVSPLLLRTVSLPTISSHIAAATILDVVNANAARYTIRNAVYLSVRRGNLLYEKLREKFLMKTEETSFASKSHESPEMDYSIKFLEIEVSSIPPHSLTLLSLLGPFTDDSLNHLRDHSIDLAIHSRDKESLEQDALLRWMFCWFDIEIVNANCSSPDVDETIGFHTMEMEKNLGGGKSYVVRDNADVVEFFPDHSLVISAVQEFQQAGLSTCPLSPLRESKCIVVSDGSQSSSVTASAASASVASAASASETTPNPSARPFPPLILAGDWAAGGTVSGALLSGEAAVKALVKMLPDDV